MKKLIFLSIVSVLFLTSCLEDYFRFLDSLTSYVEVLEFNESSYTIDKDGYTYLNIKAYPQDSFEYYELSYSVSDKGIIETELKNGNTIVAKGIGTGTVTVAATLNNKQALCVINVK